MQNYMRDLCNAADINKASDLNLLALAEQCAFLEDQVYALSERLSMDDQALLCNYIDARNDLECESVRAALRWGMQHPK